MTSKIKYMLPKAENFVRLANVNIVRNRRRRREAKLNFPSLIERAYIVTNETGVVPYEELPGDTEIKVRQ